MNKIVIATSTCIGLPSRIHVWRIFIVRHILTVAAECLFLVKMKSICVLIITLVIISLLCPALHQLAGVSCMRISKTGKHHNHLKSQGNITSHGKIHMNIKFFIGLSLFVSYCSFAEMHWVKSENIKPAEVKTAKIIYSGEITSRQVSELISALDEINNDYPQADSIKIFISSFGGSMESGYLAMQAIKGSKIPVETINAGMTGSSATLLYCGAQKRFTLAESSFMLHPAASPNINTEWIRPNDIELLRKDVEDGNKYFKTVYKRCTTLSDEEIKKILYSNDSARYLVASEAEKIKLSQGTLAGILPTSVAYYITNDTK